MKLDTTVPVKATLLATSFFYTYYFGSLIAPAFFMSSDLDITSLQLIHAYKSVLPGFHLTILLIATIKYQGNVEKLMCTGIT